MKYILETAPTALPVTLDEVRQHMHETSSGQDAVIERLYLGGAVRKVSEYLGRALIYQTMKAFTDGFPCFRQPFELSYPPLVSVTAINYYDEQDVLQTVSPSTYQVDTVSRRGRIALVQSETWPGIRYEKLNCVEIQFVCGYGASANKIPDDIRLAIAMTTAYFYEHRDEYTEVDLKEAPGAVKELLSPYRIYEI